MADILNGFKPSPLSDFQVLDLVADLDDDACALVAGTFGAEVGHRGHGPVVEHVVDVTETEAGRVQFDEDVLGAYNTLAASAFSPMVRRVWMVGMVIGRTAGRTNLRHWDLLDFDVEVGSFIFLFDWVRFLGRCGW